MNDGPALAAATVPVRRGTGTVAVTGAAVLSAYGRGTEALLSGVLSGRPAFATVDRFDVAGRRVGVAATMPGSPDLLSELARVVHEACDEAGLSSSDRAGSPLFVAVHCHPEQARAAEADQRRLGPEAFAAAQRCTIRVMSRSHAVIPVAIAFQRAAERESRSSEYLHCADLREAPRHSGCTRVQIDLRAEGSWISLSVAENGVGFDPSIESRGQGLMGMFRRAKLLGGSVEIDSRVGHGTTIRMRVPAAAVRVPTRR